MVGPEHSSQQATLGPIDCLCCGTRHVPVQSALYRRWHTMVTGILERMQQGIICNILAYAHNDQIDVEIFRVIDKIVDIRTIVSAADDPRALDIAGANFLKASFDQMDDLHAQLKLLQAGTHRDNYLFTPDDIWAVGLEESRVWRCCKKFQILMRFITTDEVLPVAE